jgi:hypothetical protein
MVTPLASWQHVLHSHIFRIIMLLAATPKSMASLEKNVTIYLDFSGFYAIIIGSKKAARGGS